MRKPPETPSDESKSGFANDPVQLELLVKQLDGLVAQMQTPEHRAGVAAFLKSTPQQLGEAAVEAAQKK